MRESYEYVRDISIFYGCFLTRWNFFKIKSLWIRYFRCWYYICADCICCPLGYHYCNDMCHLDTEICEWPCYGISQRYEFLCQSSVWNDSAVGYLLQWWTHDLTNFRLGNLLVTQLLKFCTVNFQRDSIFLKSNLIYLCMCILSSGALSSGFYKILLSLVYLKTLLVAVNGRMICG
jgi:hypothetical protein